MSATESFYDFLISRIKDYIEVSDEEIEIIHRLFVKEHFRKNAVLLREGEVCRKLFFVAKGIVRFSKLSDGEDRTYAFRVEGTFCLELESFLQKVPSKSAITAIEPTTVLSITYENLQIFYNELRYGDRFGRRVTEQAFIQVVNLLTTFNSGSPEQRYLRFAMNHKPFMPRIPQYYIASHIGVTPQALCRIKKKLLGKNL
ncbi:MAG: Crp/Fnr family transcriptional [Bacteroidetes bacterium]|nr:MAG: Crp/Fnr family transcriptional [Bacteroidota bacterium]